jgi:3-deoxy-D-manno-octulosonic-acid transferase
VGLAYDIAYTLALPAFLPALLRKRRHGLRERFGHLDPLPAQERPRLLIHAVSVGEVNLITPLVRLLSDAHGVDVIVSVTTDTGLARARQVHSGHATVVRYPLDFSRSVRRFLDAVRPDVVALTELELWPNFASECASRAIPLSIINGRLSERSFRGYRRARPFLRRAFGSLDVCAAQSAEYARRFEHMGVAPERIRIAGSMKWDSVRVGERVEGVDDFADRFGLDRSRPIVVAGSTAPDEHALLRDAIPPGVQVVCAPRRPEWFDEAARDLPGCARWSRRDRGSAADRFLLDAIGELRRAYALADVVIVGRSFGDLYGSDPMEPAALGKPILIGPRYGDFTQSVEALRESGALRVVDRSSLGGAVRELLSEDSARERMGQAAIECVLEHQGSTSRHASILLELLGVNARAEGAWAAPEAANA